MTAPPPQSGAASNLIYSGKIVRRADSADIEAVMALAESVPAAAKWSWAAYRTYCVREQQTGETLVKALFVAVVPAQRGKIPRPVGSFHSAALEKFVGFAAFSAVLHGVGGDCDLENMAVVDPLRRQGIGRRLLAAGLLWCRVWCPPDRASIPAATPSSGLRLEVRASNTNAIAFYRQMGFEIAGRRPGYYENPAEDAVLMRKS